MEGTWYENIADYQIEQLKNNNKRIIDCPISMKEAFIAMPAEDRLVLHVDGTWKPDLDDINPGYRLSDRTYRLRPTWYRKQPPKKLTPWWLDYDDEEIEELKYLVTPLGLTPAKYRETIKLIHREDPTILLWWGWTHNVWATPNTRAIQIERVYRLSSAWKKPTPLPEPKWYLGLDGIDIQRLKTNKTALGLCSDLMKEAFISMPPEDRLWFNGIEWVQDCSERLTRAYTYRLRYSWSR